MAYIGNDVRFLILRSNNILINSYASTVVETYRSFGDVVKIVFEASRILPADCISDYCSIAISHNTGVEDCVRFFVNAQEEYDSIKDRLVDTVFASVKRASKRSEKNYASQFSPMLNDNLGNLI